MLIRHGNSCQLLTLKMGGKQKCSNLNASGNRVPVWWGTHNDVPMLYWYTFHLHASVLAFLYIKGKAKYTYAFAFDQ